MWFAAFQPYQHNPWLVHLVYRLLNNDALVTGLLAENPFVGEHPPTCVCANARRDPDFCRYIRLDHYTYKYTRLGINSTQHGWWTRRRIGEYMPPVNVHMLANIVHQFKWDTRQ
jgi:hypothetical protein